MRKPKNVGRLIAIGTIALALFVAIMFVILFNQWLNGDKGNVEFIAKVDEIEEAQKKNFYENWWDKKIVAEILEDEVPVPEGFEFVSGTKETGIIIKDKETNAELMWIPYDENAKVEGIEEYYKNVEYKYIDSETLESIEKYGGFYVTLEEQNQYEALKEVDDASYKEAIKQANKLYENKESVNSHLVSLTELEQIITFANKNGMEIVQTKLNEKNEYKVDKLLSINSTVTKIDNTNRALGLISVPIEIYTGITKTEHIGSDILAYTVITENKIGKENVKTEVPIPKGYAYQVKTDKNKTKQIVKITDMENRNLVYTWVPVNEKESVYSLEKAREELNKKYSELNVKNNWSEAKDPTDSEEYKQVLASVEEYGGFYIGEAELGYIDNYQQCNRARGMEEGLVNEGEYYRYDLTYEKAKEIASSIKNSAGSTISHLTYGAEWDATMLWIMKTNESITNTELTIEQGVIQSSIEMPGCKYAGKMDGLEEGTQNLEKVNKIHGIYGLAGNLSDITQEFMDEGGIIYRILRGGSYATPGNEYPMASRQKVANVDSANIGFRNCLYIVPGASGKEQNKWTGEIAKGFAGGKGTENNPYLIETPEQLAYLAQDVNKGNDYSGKYIKIIKSLDLNNKKWTPISFTYINGEETIMYMPFEGVLDGGENTISGLFVEEENFAGLFGSITGKAVVKNITISSGTVKANETNAGGIAGYICNTAKIENCKNSGTVNAVKNYAGGIAGYANDTARIEKCANNGVITANSFTGGIVGSAVKNVVIKECTNEGDVLVREMDAGGIAGNVHDGVVIQNCRNGGIITSNNFTGGITGKIKGNAKIKECTNEGNVTAENVNAGGIAGNVDDGVVIQNCRNNGVITAKNFAGGISGNALQNAVIKECTNEGDVTVSEMNTGGITGRMEDTAIIEKCTNNGTITSGDEVAGGIVGLGGGYHGGNCEELYKVKGCTNTGKVVTNSYCGGIIGYVSCNCSIEECTNSGELVCYAMAAGEIFGGKKDTVTIK